jgi:Protein of unknown function (DUF3435)
MLVGFGTGHISDAQRNLCLQHAPNSTVFQTNYLSHHITASTHEAYRKLSPQTAIMQAATGMSRTIDKRRPRHLTQAQQEEAHRHPRVQSLLRKKINLKNIMKAQGRTVKSYKGTKIYREYQEATQAYENEFKFQKKALLKEIKRKFEKEQPVIDIQNQIHGMTIKEEKDIDLVGSLDLIPERLEVIDALLTFVTSLPEEERKRRVRAINALVALGRIQDGYRYPVRRGKRPPLMPMQRVVPEPLSLECKPTQCYLCRGNRKASTDKRTREFHSRGDLKKHLIRYHVQRHKGSGPISCTIDGAALCGEQAVLSHGHMVHKTPTLLYR